MMAMQELLILLMLPLLLLLLLLPDLEGLAVLIVQERERTMDTMDTMLEGKVPPLHLDQQLQLQLHQISRSCRRQQVGMSLHVAR
mmetsp:Transcript_97953/g.179434  ORF Transcript_97953/g.179434 Transcript_97953/m.179434 type:complete len:85 (+) Transcript_97953:1436-1690(+)